MTLESTRLIEILEDAGYEARSYSGRCMYGARCVSVTVPQRAAAEVGAKAVLAAAQDAEQYEGDGIEWAEAEAVAALMAHTSTDSMGRDIVLYWEEMEWPGDEDRGRE